MLKWLVLLALTLTALAQADEWKKGKLLMSLSSNDYATPVSYQQSHPIFCNLTNYVCNQIPLVGGGEYSFVSGSKSLSPGDEFTLFDLHIGTITAVQQQPPNAIGQEGPFSFTWSTTDGLSGSVSGYVVGGKTCGRYCWFHAYLESSTVTVF